MAQKYLTHNPALSIDECVRKLSPDKVLVVTDKNVESKVLPKLSSSETLNHSPRITILAGEEYKNLKTVEQVWNKLEEIGATRRSLILNIGGGVVTDLGGFAASVYKRGIRTVNFPTTLLGAVDAATGGKTGIDFNGLKNEIGSFHVPSDVLISTLPFSTLPPEEIMSGYAEMIKTAMISSRDFYLKLLDPDTLLEDEKLLGESVETCVQVKEEIVAQDPQEKGLRKVLNFGHTAGHAFESMLIERTTPVTHGKAVAHGILVALILSRLKLDLKTKEIDTYSSFLKQNYGLSLINCKDIDRVMELMASDKKNRQHGEPLFTLLREIGSPEIDQKVSVDEIREALEYYIELAS